MEIACRRVISVDTTSFPRVLCISIPHDIGWRTGRTSEADDSKFQVHKESVVPSMFRFEGIVNVGFDQLSRLCRLRKNRIGDPEHFLPHCAKRWNYRRSDPTTRVDGNPIIPCHLVCACVILRAHSFCCQVFVLLSMR